MDDAVAHTIVPKGGASYIGLDDGETKNFCSEGETISLLAENTICGTFVS